ncbi:N-acetylmuramoyl-L-alanine amidase [Caulobacter segnis]|uniref:N-acetylmuramoyl-L-alanine amidase n=1 Tax=Caulobacter segnis TaxID=88688 RepID=A0A2W5VDB2_9CAUL|nr:N-acetylmuramoyl-L-alanine amidase [Caulobacter segnis]PZR36507.1 MAG: N-acetylmuramoyl-L-alanine amidase [Caulobacter segnis]
MNAPLGPIRFLTIHCAATPEGRDVSPDDIARWDIDRFGQESYHLIVTLDGEIHRRLPDTVKGAHVAKANSGNIGVCYVGGLAKDGKTPKDTRTDLQRAALAQIVHDYRERVPNLIVRGHRDWPGVAKACPSFDVAPWLKSLG